VNLYLHNGRLLGLGICIMIRVVSYTYIFRLLSLYIWSWSSFFMCCHIIPDYQLTPSKWRAGGGNATHKEPSQAPLADQVKSKNPQTWLPPAHPYPLQANVCQASPLPFAKG
jgi:hypothetical protein